MPAIYKILAIGVLVLLCAALGHEVVGVAVFLSVLVCVGLQPPRPPRPRGGSLSDFIHGD